jgi:hypothetical protein
VALDGQREQIVETGEAAPVRDEADPLMTVEPGQGRESAALHFDDRDAQVGSVQDELLERLAALRDHQQADRLSMGQECFLDGMAARDQLLALAQQFRGGNGIRVPFQTLLSGFRERE